MKVFKPVRRLVIAVAGSDAFAAIAPKIVPPLDRTLHRLTGGRVILARAMLPALMLTTTGRKTGKPRQVPLATMPDGEGFIVVGSNFGRESHPAWSANLLANPDAVVDYRGAQIPVRARRLEGEARDEVWPKLNAIWPNFDRYLERTDRYGRDIRIFRLEPVRDDEPDAVPGTQPSAPASRSARRRSSS